MATLNEILQGAQQRHQAGDLAGAEPLYRQALQLAPQEADAWQGLGLLAMQTRRPQLASDCFGRVLALQPTAAGHNNLGVAYQSLGRLDEALASYRAAIRLNADYAPGYDNLGKVLRQQGHLDEAVAAFKTALRLQPAFAAACLNLADTLAQQGNLPEAVQRYRQAIALQPAGAQAHNNLGVVLLRQGQPESARPCFEKALALDPSFAEARHNLDGLRHRQAAPAATPTDAGPAVRSGDPEADLYCNRGHALQLEGRFKEAMACFRRALELDPNHGSAHSELGTLWQAQGRLEEAEACYRQALRCRPDFVPALNNLGTVLKNTGRLAEAYGYYRAALRLQPGHVQAHSNFLLDLNYDPDLDPDTLFTEHLRWAEAHAAGLPVHTAHANVPDPERRLRVGYVSAHLHWHPVARFLEPILAGRDPGQVEVFLYADVFLFDDVSARLRRLADHWRDLTGLSDAQAAELVRADGIDVLVDLAGHTGGHRLLAFVRKPAPVQMTYLGYPNTTGLQALDYRLTDAVADPPGEPVRHTETLLRLEPVFCCYAPPAEAPEVAPLPASRSGRVTFGSVQGLAKINGRVLDLWARLLEEVPSARLRLCRDSLQESARQRLEREFAERGIDRERLEFQHLTDPRRHSLDPFRDIDVALDTFPWSGHTTACEGLWMGVPVVTLRGRRHAGRMVASVLTCLGLQAWIGDTPEAYVAAAAALANDLEGLARWRARLRGHLAASPLCDAAAFSRALEKAYRQVWRHWCTSR